MKLSLGVAASVALHVAAFVMSPAARRAVATPIALAPIELAAPPPPPPAVEEAAPPAEPARVAAAPRAAAPRAAVTTTSAESSAPAIAVTATTNEGPADFTSTVVSGGGGTAPTTIASAPRAVAAPTVVPASNLSRLPRAPGLDRALERNYPPDARRAGVAGTAVLRVQVLATGRIGRVTRTSESAAGFGAACERTVREATWDAPLDRDGAAVATEITYTCRFEVRS